MSKVSVFKFNINGGSFMDKNFYNVRKFWSEDPYFDSDTRNTVTLLSDSDCKEAFGNDLEF